MLLNWNGFAQEGTLPPPSMQSGRQGPAEGRGPRISPQMWVHYGESLAFTVREVLR